MRISDWSSDVCSSDLSSQYPNKIFTVLDFRGDATTLSDAALARRRSDAEKDAKDRVDALLKRVQAKQYAPATMTSEERRSYDMFADVPGDRMSVAEGQSVSVCVEIGGSRFIKK